MAIEAIAILIERMGDVYGSKALLDAIGNTMNPLIRRIGTSRKERKPDRVMIVIMTDGMDNTSRRYSHADIIALIRQQHPLYDWEFVFLGASIGSARTASGLGIRKDRVSQYHADETGSLVPIGICRSARTMIPAIDGEKKYIKSLYNPGLLGYDEGVFPIY